MKSKSKLKKMSMPGSKNPDLPMDLHDSASEETSAEDSKSDYGDTSDSSKDMEPMGSPDAPPSQLDKVSDDELMAELKKRGLKSELDKPEGESDELPPDFGMES